MCRAADRRARRTRYLICAGARRLAGRIGAWSLSSAGHRACRALLPGVVRPLLDEHAPGLRHSAALIGWGSEVLGFDSPRSTDHNWGPRCQIFVGPADADRAGDITAMLADRLPETFEGWPARFVT